MTHYHIHWSRQTRDILDWQRFDTADEAHVAAKELVQPGEEYAIEQFDGDCQRCIESMKPLASSRRTDPPSP